MLAKFIRDPKAYLRSRPRGVEPPPLIKSGTERPPKKRPKGTRVAKKAITGITVRARPLFSKALPKL